jgi:hypothetical protein
LAASAASCGFCCFEGKLKVQISTLAASGSLEAAFVSLKIRGISFYKIIINTKIVMHVNSILHKFFLAGPNEAKIISPVK